MLIRPDFEVSFSARRRLSDSLVFAAHTRNIEEIRGIGGQGYVDSVSLRKISTLALSSGPSRLTVHYILAVLSDYIRRHVIVPVAR